MIKYLILFISFCIYNAVVFAEELKIKPLEQYYLDGIYEYVDRNYTSATEQFEALSHNYPFSKRTHNALIMEAFLNFINNEQEKIDGIVEVFLRLFPDDSYVPYMKYLHAMGYYTKIKGDDRSTDAMRKSKILFTALINEHPNSKYTEDAKKKNDYLDKLMQLNEVKTGETFFSRRNYIGAMKRFTGIFQRYKVLIPEIEERLLCRIIVLSNMLKLNDNALKYEKILKEKYKKTICTY